MPRGVRYTPQEKAQMREKALKMKAEGSSQKAIAEELGVAIPTARELLGGGTKRSQAGAKRGGDAALPKSHPAILMAEKQARLEAIDKEIAGLEQERDQIDEDLKTLYEELGKEILGDDSKKAAQGKRGGKK
jgi:transposase-like protein